MDEGRRLLIGRDLGHLREVSILVVVDEGRRLSRQLEEAAELRKVSILVVVDEGRRPGPGTEDGDRTQVSILVVVDEGRRRHGYPS